MQDQAPVQPDPEPTSEGNGLEEAFDWLAAQLHVTGDWLRDIWELLLAKRQVIFYGPPGTGKTYVAQKLAEFIAGDESRVRIVQFHPSYSYEDFVEGYRPTLQGGTAGFMLRHGPLRQMAEAAQNDPDGTYILLIDEINRGSLAKVFGELYFLLEYRDHEMQLLYSDEPFSLPRNLWIIGTMNTADRSIALVDAALRRRFYFIPFFPSEEPIKSVLRKWLRAMAPGMTWVADVVDTANHEIGDQSAAIGPSYFMRDDLDEAWVERIWQYSVMPYLEEQLYGDTAKLDQLTLEKLRSRLQDVKQESFDAAVEGDTGDVERDAPDAND